MSDHKDTWTLGPVYPLNDYSWVDERYMTWLIDQGVEWVIAFASLSESHQRGMQDAWLAVHGDT